MKRNFKAAAGVITVSALALSLAACNSGPTTPEATGSADGSTAPESTGPVTLTLSGWALDTTPEFQVLADAFEAHSENVTIELKEYDPAEYNTLLTTDLAAGVGPDIVTQKEVKALTTFQEGGQLLDLSDVALPDGVGGTDSYKVDGVSYAVPYRLDSWVIFYNKDLYDAAGVEYPDGSWTWDDYAAALDKLKTGLPEGVYPAYQHGWQSTVQGFANGQTPGADILSGKYDHLKPYYERVLDFQDKGLQIDFNTRNANQLTYQGEFGKQKAANLIMGTWYVATLIAQQASGDADTFAWGMAPAPQLDASTAGTDKTPVTFGDPTGFGINANIAADKLEAAKAFLAFAASEEAAQALAAIGITPALINDAVVETYFGAKGAPGDDLSKFAWATHETKPENPPSNVTAQIQGILSDLHSDVLSGNAPIDAAITTAQDRVANEVSR